MKNKVLGKSLQLLESVASAGRPLSLKSLSESLSMHPSTLSRIANDFVEAGYLRKTSYHEFEASLGLIYLGQRATLNCKFPRKVNRLLAARCRESGLKGALAGVFRKQLVYLFNSSHEESPKKLGMPFTNLPHSSNIALVVLARTHGAEKALQIIEASSRNDPHGPYFERIEASCRERLKQLDAKGYSLLAENGFWNACVPLEWRGFVFGLALYSAPEKEQLVKELMKLRDDVAEELMNS